MTTARPNPEHLQVWRFVRGDTAPREFEHWVCSEAGLEETLGPELYLELISADYRDRYVIGCLKERLDAWVRERGALQCQCITLPDLAVVDMGEEGEVFETLEEKVSRGAPFWWLSAYNCRACGDGWLVGQEERHNDVFCMRRLREEEVASILTGREWPKDFDRYEDLLRVGLEAGKKVDYIDPMDSGALRWTLQDLAKARPGIRISELAALLNLDFELASALAREIVEETGVIIEFDHA